jgi:hypothetical protein
MLFRIVPLHVFPLTALKNSITILGFEVLTAVTLQSPVQMETALLVACLLLVSCIAQFSTTKMETINFSETPRFLRTTQCYNKEDYTQHNHRCKHLNFSNKVYNCLSVRFHVSVLCVSILHRLLSCTILGCVLTYCNFATIRCRETSDKSVSAMVVGFSKYSIIRAI